MHKVIDENEMHFWVMISYKLYEIKILNDSSFSQDTLVAKYVYVEFAPVA